VENTPYTQSFLYEHGLSLFIETENKRILFDAGESDRFAENAKRLRVDLASADLAVLSHGHYDHSGGLATFLSLNHSARVYVSRFAMEPHFEGATRYIGVDPALAVHPRIVPVGDRFSLGEGLELLSCNELPRPYFMDHYDMNVFQNGVLTPDTFLHEQYLVVREQGKTIVFSGCSHKGVLNIAQWLKPDVLIGGFHYMNMDPEGQDKNTLNEAASVLLSFPTRYCTCHCTGLAQYAYLKRLMGDRLCYLASGQTVTL
jgi:7,8-dihydropterin-6-yl-methyl-4-(beta-D-ribofuranosyl)aminobenzene 5'-phosphate synthase